MAHTILIADDETNIRKVLAAMLRRLGHRVIQAPDGAQAMAELKLNDVSVIITDLRMPHTDGMSLLKHALRHYPDIPVIVLTAYGTVDIAVEALKLGAFDFVTKPFDADALGAIVAKALGQLDANRKELQAADPSANAPEHGRFGIISISPMMQQVFRIIERVADTPSSVLISGESGTGKELIAKALHQQSSRRNKPFIRINCAAIPENLVESELFGYEQGAFTGANNAKPGRFELADGGTLFLDEIGEIPPETQVKLLRVLQESEFERVGAIKTTRVDVRLIAATNRELSKEIEHGRFRDDLYYRLNVVPIALPPLRDRLIDIPLLVQYFVEKNNLRLNRKVKEITDEAIAALQRYPWPGNIRELENLIERTLLFIDGERIDVEDLPTEILQNSNPHNPIVPIHLPAADGAGVGLKEVVRETTSLLEKQYITKALEDTQGNVTQAARILQISRKSLQIKMKEFGLRDE